MSLKHLIAIPVIIVVCVALGWFGRPYVESRLATNETPSATKIYQGFDFSFVYPAAYTASEKGLWSEGRYETSLNPPKNSELASLPDIKLIDESFFGTVKEYFEKDLKVRFDEVVNNENLSFEEINLNGEKYYKVVDYEMLRQVYYVKQDGTRIVGFETLNTEGHEPEVLEMLKSLKFE